jgi:signal transduction histidine kinase
MGEAGRLRAEGRGAVADTVEEIVGAMRAHVDRELARTRVAMRGRQARAEIADAFAGLLRVMRRTEDGARCDWRVDLPRGLIAAADPGDLSEALGALIENAARHARSCVEISGRRRGRQIEIAIRDDGPGIPPDRIELLMARGARADTRGSGLGLAIARDIAEALDGTLALRSASRGLEALLTVPAAEGFLTDH